MSPALPNEQRADRRVKDSRRHPTFPNHLSKILDCSIRSVPAGHARRVYDREAMGKATDNGEY